MHKYLLGYLLGVIVITIGAVLLTDAVGAQEQPTPQPVQGDLEDGTVLPEKRMLVTEVLDVEQGSQCQAHSLNNISVYPPNLLQLIKGRGGEHDADMSFHPIERSEGEDVVIDFVATGGDIQAWIFYESEPAPGTSIDAVPITCTPPPPDTTTTTTTTVVPRGPCDYEAAQAEHDAYVAAFDAENPGWRDTVTPEQLAATNELLAAHLYTLSPYTTFPGDPTCPPPTSTTVPTTPTTGTTVPPVDTCPDDGLACTGQTSQRGITAGIIALMMGVVALAWGRQFA